MVLKSSPLTLIQGGDPFGSTQRIERGTETSDMRWTWTQRPIEQMWPTSEPECRSSAPEQNDSGEANRDIEFASGLTLVDGWELSCAAADST